MKERKIYDITVPLRPSMPLWPSDPGFKRSTYHSFEQEGSYEASMITMGSHTGTHVDAPAHFVEGASSVDLMPLNVLVGKASVIELGVEKEISRADLEVLSLDGVERVLFKTRNSSLYEKGEFASDFVYLTPDGAQYLVDKGVKLVGVDYLSVDDPNSAGSHHTLLGNGVIIIETLDLSNVEPGEYEILCLPLKVIGSEGAPARVVLREI